MEFSIHEMVILSPPFEGKKRQKTIQSLPHIIYKNKCLPDQEGKSRRIIDAKCSTEYGIE